MEGVEGRPYRSHVRPACMPCRRRKSRCTVEAHSSACMMCRAHGTDCSFPAEKGRKTLYRTPRRAHATGDTEVSGEGNSRPPATRTVPSSSVPTVQPLHLPNIPFSTGNASSQPTHVGWAQSQAAQDTPLSLEADDDNPHILGPAVMGDSHILADYLSSIPGNRGMRAIRPVELGSSSFPIVFTKVQKRPLGMMLNSNPALHKLQVIEKLIEPWALHLVDM